MTYSEKLKDQRWKRKRVDILIRDRHTCQICGYIGTKVNVHHLKYTGDPWEAPNEDLITLCKECHRKTHTPEINDKKLDSTQVGNIINRMKWQDQ